MSNNQLDTTTQDKKEQNLQLIANSLQAEMAKDFLKQTENYDNKRIKYRLNRSRKRKDADRNQPGKHSNGHFIYR
jgi:hypothetical protein